MSSVVVWLVLLAGVACFADIAPVAAVKRAAGAVTGPFRCVACERDEHGKVKRSRAVVNEFRKRYPKPAVCIEKDAKCVVDHIIPLACAVSPGDHHALDAVSNMQWQTRIAGKIKDRWELRLCGVTISERIKVARQHGQELPEYLVGVGAVTWRSQGTISR